MTTATNRRTPVPPLGDDVLANGNREITCVAEQLTIQATAPNSSGEAAPRFSMVAYTGGAMQLDGWRFPVVVDLAGLDVPSQRRPIRFNHSAHEGVGHTDRIVVEAGKLLAEGVVSRDTPAAREVVTSGKRGFPWQASIGARIHQVEFVRAGQRAEANGRTFDGPVSIARRATLGEISFVDLGADGDTAALIAARRQAGESNVEENVVTDTVAEIREQEAAETQRVAAIRKVCGDKWPKIEAQAIADGWTADRAELEVLRAARPKAPRSYVHCDPVVGSDALEASILCRLGFASLGEKTLSAAAMERGEQIKATHALDLCRAALMLDGAEVPAGREAMVKAALSTTSLPVALGNVANKVLLDAYNEVPATWRAFAAVRSVPDFKQAQAIRPSFGRTMEKVNPGGEVKHATVGEETSAFQIDTYGQLLSIDRRDIINDDLGLFVDSAAALGRAALRRLSDLVYEVLLGNAGSFFASGNNNLLTGVDTVLGIDSLALAIAAMRKQRDAEGNDLDLRPATLLVPPELETIARALLESEFIQRAEDVPTGNSLRKSVNLEVESRLSNTTKFTNASTTGWYLFGAPSTGAMIAAFLNGVQTPTLEAFGLEADVNRLAYSWRCHFDFGAAFGDPRAAVHATGVAA